MQNIIDDHHPLVEDVEALHREVEEEVQFVVVLRHPVQEDADHHHFLIVDDDRLPLEDAADPQ